MQLYRDLCIKHFLAQRALVNRLDMLLIQMFLQFFGFWEKFVANLTDEFRVYDGEMFLDMVFVFLAIFEGYAALVTH
jgi:hypothetical protein